MITALSSQLYTTEIGATVSKSLIAQLQDIEQARTVSPALAARQGGLNQRSRVLAGAVIGFALGLLAAILWDPVARAIHRNETAA